jgi:hypothetical protein
MKKQILHRSWNILFQFILGADRCGMLLTHRRHFLVSHSGLGMAGAKQRQNGPCLSNPVGRCGLAAPNQSPQAILKIEAASLFIQLIDIDEIL